MSLEYDKTANNGSAYASALYLNNAVFKQQQDNIKNNESGLKLDISALESQDKINGTECVGLLLANWSNVANSGDTFRNFGTGVLDTTLGKMAMSINKVDDAAAKSINIERGVASKPANINGVKTEAENMDKKSPASAGGIAAGSTVAIAAGAAGAAGAKAVVAAGSTDAEKGNTSKTSNKNGIKMEVKNMDAEHAALAGAIAVRDTGSEVFGPAKGRVTKNSGYDVQNVAKQEKKELDCAVPMEGEYQGTNPFDEHGSFGGNQEDMGMGTSFSIFGIAGKDEALYKFIRTHKGFENYSNDQIHDLLKDVEAHGCTFVALANSIFEHYRSDKESFRDKLGFPMIGENGDLNYRFLIMDIVCNTGFKIYLDDATGVTPLANYFYHFPDEVKNKNLYDEKLDRLQNAENAALQLYNQNGENKVFETKYLRGPVGSVFNRGLHYFKEKGLELNMGPLLYEDDYFVKVKEEVEKGHIVICSVHNYTFEDAEGNQVFNTEGTNNAHEITIVGVTKDNRFIVSSKGKKYYYNPSKQKSKESDISEFYYISRDSYKWVPHYEWANTPHGSSTAIKIKQ